MKVGVLGDLVADLDGTPVVLPSGKPRQILAVLALSANRVVPVPVLKREIWGDRPPRSASTTIQTYILKLRRRLDDASPSRDGGSALATVHGSYRLDIDPSDVDAHAFDTLLHQGQAALRAGDNPCASELLGNALRLWRGAVLADVERGRLLAVEAVRLSENGLIAHEQRIAADLSLGRHSQLVGELTALTERYPTNETLHGQLMIALHRSGSRDGAVRVYRKLRATLAEELGMEPVPSLHRLYLDVLDHTSG
jgi:DNA-binding SARP family transcriptional activator